MKIKVAVVGFGHIGKRHSTIISNNINYELVGIIDIKDPNELNFSGFEKIPFFYGSVRNIKTFYVWGRNFSKAKKLCKYFTKNKINAVAVKNIKEISKKVDIISCVMPSKKSLVLGKNVSKGCHIDLVGAFNISMRESDDNLIKKGKVFFDNKEGGFKEAGDILIPLKKKLISKKHIKGDFYDLIQGKIKGRTSNE